MLRRATFPERFSNISCKTGLSAWSASECLHYSKLEAAVNLTSGTLPTILNMRHQSRHQSISKCADQHNLELLTLCSSPAMTILLSLATAIARSSNKDAKNMMAKAGALLLPCSSESTCRRSRPLKSRAPVNTVGKP